MSRASNSTIAALIEWLILAFATIIKLIRDGKRSEEDLEPLKTAMQAVIDGKPFRATFSNLSKSLKNLAISLDPAKIRLAWVALYMKWGIEYNIPPIPYDSDRIKLEKDRGRILIYLSPELSTVGAIPKLGELFPRMISEVLCVDNKIENTEDLSGWMFVEEALNVPNSNTTGSELKKIFRQQSARGMTLNVYIIFGQFCKEIFGEYYPDIPGFEYVRLLGSSAGGDVLCAGFNQDGSLSVRHRWSPGYHSSDMGGRSVAV